MIKKLLPTLILSTGLLLAFCLPFQAVSAQNLEQACQVDPNSALCQDHRADSSGSRLTGVLRSVANMVSILAGIAGVIMIMIGGFRYIRSSGEPAKLSEAQSTIIYAIIGLLVAAAGQLIVAFVLNRAT